MLMFWFQSDALKLPLNIISLLLWSVLSYKQMYLLQSKVLKIEKKKVDVNNGGELLTNTCFNFTPWFLCCYTLKMCHMHVIRTLLVVTVIRILKPSLQKCNSIGPSLRGIYFTGDSTNTLNLNTTSVICSLD